MMKPLSRFPILPIGALISLLAVIIFGIYVWPTPWHYANHPDGLAIRTHGFTGEAQYLSRQGWNPMKGLDDPKAPRPLP